MKRVLYILGKLNDHDLEWMIENGSTMNVSKGENLIRKGEALEHLFIVLSGGLEIYTDGENERAIAKLGSGEMVGEMSFLDSRPPSVNVVATEDSKCYSIPIERMRLKINADSSFASRLYQSIALFLSNRLRTTTGRLGYGVIEDDPDEMDINILRDVSQAGARFTRMVNKFSEV